MFYGVTDPEDLVRVSPYDAFRGEITITGPFAAIKSFPAAIAAQCGDWKVQKIIIECRPD